ncbi:LRC14 protein, partial [Cettia cetti]|nr:LRC14 protein [Cettia cetti]
HPCKLCVQAVILAVVAQLRRQLEEPGHPSRWVLGILVRPRPQVLLIPSSLWMLRSRFSRLRVLDVTGVPDDPAGRAPDGMSVWSGTVALAKACVEVSK